ncbi:interleukin-21 receptor-like [Pyxicephalus adspersus]|uniref:interleukin-21 receptor-like n=1 Tax=Pyxicephalus adspersus TaxID=30357 RepID=UPI003B5C1C72
MKRRSKAIVVLLLSFCSLTMAATGCKDLICYVDYIDTLTCTYNNDKHGIGKTLNSMDVEWTLEESVETCELIPSDGKNEYTCNIDMEDFFFDTGCTVFINPANNWNDALRKTCGPFKIGEKFMPRAPFNLTVSLSENYNISWRSLYDNEVYRSYMLAYELAYKTNAESWLNQKTVQLYEDEKSLVLLRSLFKADEIYVARIRARPKNSSIYRGHWGSWSTPVLWRTPKDGISLEKSWQNWVIILMVLFSLSVAIVLFAFKWPKW